MMFVTGDGVCSCSSGEFGFVRSHTYAWFSMPSGICWNRKIAYDTAALIGPSGCHEISEMLRFACSDWSLPGRSAGWGGTYLLEQHQRFRAQVLHLVLALLVQKVLLEQVDLVVLRDAPLHSPAQLLHRVRERWVLLDLLLVLVRVLGFRRVDPLRPLRANPRSSPRLTPPSLWNMPLSPVLTRSVFTWCSLYSAMLSRSMKFGFRDRYWNCTC